MGSNKGVRYMSASDPLHAKILGYRFDNRDINYGYGYLLVYNLHYKNEK